jgi:hypothetical protein
MTTGSLPNPGRSIYAVLSIATALLASACAKKADTTQTETPAAASPAAAAAPDLSATAAGAIDMANAEAQAAELTQAVRKYAAEKQRAPKSFEEIAAAGYLPSIPSAPAGKAYIIDKNLQVQLADN